MVDIPVLLDLNGNPTIVPLTFPDNVDVAKIKEGAKIHNPGLTIWDQAHEAHPNYADNNLSRDAFKYQYAVHPKGQFFQGHVKNGIQAAINFIHAGYAARDAFTYSDPRVHDLEQFLKDYAKLFFFRTGKPEDGTRQYDCVCKVIDIAFGNKKKSVFQSIVKYSFEKSIAVAHKGFLRYDSQAFVYDDPRLTGLDRFLKNYARQNFTKKECELAYKGIDIVCGLIKEDIYYRSRALDAANKLLEQFPQGFELNPEEKKDLEQWRLLDLTNQFIKRFPQGFELTDTEKNNIERFH